MFRLLGTVAVLVLLAPASALAQVVPDALSFTLSPEYPRPYDEVTVTVTSSLVNLPTSDITIYANGAVIEKGRRSAVIRMGAAGTATMLRATVVSSEGTFSLERSLRPAEIALVVEPTATAHPSYDGALLVPSEGRVRIVAVADLRSAANTRVANENIAYTWRFGDKILEDQSGFGRNVLTATAPPRYRDAKVSVTAETRDRTISAYAMTTVSPVDPIVRLYRKDPLRGIDFAHALSGTVSARGAEETLRAVPYFFSIIPELTWLMNGDESGKAEDITLRASADQGSAVLSASAETETEAASASATIQFGETKPRGIFGF